MHDVAQLRIAFAVACAALVAGCETFVGDPVLEARMKGKSFADIRADTALRDRAIAYGGSIFGRETCSTCHGAAGEGSRAWCPPLNDDEWIWGGSDESIARTIAYGVRQMRRPATLAEPLGVPAPNTRYSIMPRYDSLLSGGDIARLARYVRALDAGEAVDSGGASLYGAHCARCHGASAEGDTSVGAPRLVHHAWIQHGNPAHLEEYIALGGYASTSRDARVRTQWSFDIGGMREWAHPLFGLRDEQIRSVTLFIGTLRRR
jgi:cbb3-type cytochrome c oxidase subunit III